MQGYIAQSSIHALLINTKGFKWGVGLFYISKVI